MAIEWPGVLKPRRFGMTLTNFAASGGRTLNGRQQRVFNDAGFWMVECGQIIIHDRDTAFAYDAMLARLRQGEDIDVPIFAAYAPPGAEASTARIGLSGAHAARSTVLDLSASGVALQAGMLLRIEHWLYQVTELTSGPSASPYENWLVQDEPWPDYPYPWADETSAIGSYQVKIIPPLRNAYEDNRKAFQNELYVRCVLDDINSGDYTLDRSGIATPSLRFVEKAPE